jgi:hypothetical protein
MLQKLSPDCTTQSVGPAAGAVVVGPLLGGGTGGVVGATVVVVGATVVVVAGAVVVVVLGAVVVGDSAVVVVDDAVVVVGAAVVVVISAASTVALGREDGSVVSPAIGEPPLQAARMIARTPAFTIHRTAPRTA